METQSKFLNKQYLETRLREIREIKRKEINFKIEESDRAFSKSLYVNFYCPSGNGKWFKNHTLRISDHPFENCPHTQFIIDPSAFLTKKKKQQFIRALERSVRNAKTKHFYKEMENILKEDENNE
jgi:hypothetical protein